MDHERVKIPVNWIQNKNIKKNCKGQQTLNLNLDLGRPHKEGKGVIALLVYHLLTASPYYFQVNRLILHGDNIVESMNMV